MSDVIEARKLVLRGPEGDVQVELEATGQGPSMAMFLDGEPAVRAYASRSQAGDTFAAVELPGPGGDSGVSITTIGRRHLVRIDAMDDAGEILELHLGADPADDVPRIRMLRKGGDPVLELPAPTREGRRGAASRRIAELLEELREDGDVDTRRGVKQLLEEAAALVVREPGGPTPVPAGDEG